MMVRILLFALVTLSVFLVRHHPFFWDTVQLASKHAHFFHETDFTSLILPEDIDSGHPPAFGMYIALSWKWFGKSLAVSHLAMLPFLWGILLFLLKLGEIFVNRKWAPVLAVLCLSDPVLAGQSVLVSPDIPLVCFFLMAVWAIWKGERTLWLILAVTGLGLVSMRGMALGAGIFFFYWISFSERISLSSFFYKLLPFLPGGLIALAFMVYHYQQTGWIGFHEQSTWAPSFEKVDFRGFVKNMAVLGWRMLDFGRVFYWLALFIVAVVVSRTGYWKELQKDIHWRRLVLLVFITFIALVINQLPYKGLLAHRYLLPVFLSMNFLLYYLLCRGLAGYGGQVSLSRFLAVLVIAGFLTGNCWIYPKKISQGWDSTLAHLPWYDLQEEVEDYLRREEIDYEDVGTAFPNIGSREIIELNGVEKGFVEKELSRNPYIFYSNIMNDFTDDEIDALESGWREVFRKEKRGVCVILYKRPG